MMSCTKSLLKQAWPTDFMLRQTGKNACGSSTREELKRPTSMYAMRVVRREVSHPLDNNQSCRYIIKTHSLQVVESCL